MDCSSAVAIGDLVFMSPLADNTAITATNNLTPEPILGIVTGKPTTVKCLVLVRGVIPTALARGKSFVGTDGKMSLTAPLTGYVQHFGISLGNGTLVLKPEIARVKRAT